MATLLLLGSGLVAAGAAAALWLGRREVVGSPGRGRLWWSPARLRAGEDLLTRMSSLALMQIGHSRRTAGSLRTPGLLHAFTYVCETGFEHRRQSHSWLVAAYEVEHGCSRATVTSQEWLIASALAPSCRELPLSAVGALPSADNVRTVAVVEDADEWEARLRGGLGNWFATQPEARSWEIVPGLVVAHQSGEPEPEDLEKLGRAVQELAGLLKGGIDLG